MTTQHERLLNACTAAHSWLREYHTQMGSPMGDEGVMGLFDQLEEAIATPPPPDLRPVLKRALDGLHAAFPHADRIRDILQPIITDVQTALGTD